MSLSRAALAVAVVASFACGSGPQNSIPQPDLSGVEDEVAAAVTEARRAVVAEPGSAAAWAALGDRLAAHRWNEEAAAAYAAAERLEPDTFLWPYLRGVTLEIARPAAAAAAFERALANDPGYVPAHVRRAHCLSRQGNDDLARVHLERALALDPGSLHAKVALARLDFARADLEGARATLASVIAEEPRFGEAQRAMAQVEFALGHDDAAAEHAALADGLPASTPLDDPRAERPVEPAGSVAHLERGLEHVRERDADGALREFAAAIAINPDNATAHFDMANVLAGLGRLPEAERHYREAIRIRSADVEARYGLAVALARAGSLAASEGEIDAALRIDPSHPGARGFAAELRVRRGRAAEQKNDLAAAERFYREAVALDPTGAAPAFALGTLLARSRRLTEAVDLLSTAASAEPPDADALVNLAVVEVKLGRLDSARAHFERALQVRPDHPQGRRGLADCLDRIERREGGG